MTAGIERAVDLVVESYVDSIRRYCEQENVDFYSDYIQWACSTDGFRTYIEFVRQNEALEHGPN